MLKLATALIKVASGEIGRQMIQDQEKRLKVLENKQKVREDLEKERAEEKPKGWFFA